MDPALTRIERKVEDGIPLSIEDGLVLFRTWDIHNLGRIARAAKERKSGKNVFYVLNRYINSTNVCYAGCKFCSFAADEFKEKDRVVRMSADQVMSKALETGTNFNQIHIVGGHDPRQLSLDYWLPLMRRFKERLPHVQLSLFTAAELEYMCKRHRMSFAEMISRLKDAGLDNVNGGGAEIFAEETRKKICPGKVNSDNWLAIHEEGCTGKAWLRTRRCCTATSNRSKTGSIIWCVCASLKTAHRATTRSSLWHFIRMVTR